MININNLFVISDIHGHYEEFIQLLNFWNKEDDLVLLGDLIDRGPNSLRVIEKVMALKEIYGENVTFIKGNHEDMLLNYLQNPNEKREHYYKNGGKETMANFLASLSPSEIISNEYGVNEVLSHYHHELQFLLKAQLYKRIGDVLLTHAGFNSQSSTLEDTTERDFLWIRKHYLTTNQTPFINVFGHTPTKFIHDSNDIWVSEDKRYIAIDGGCYMSGQLNAVKLNVSGDIIQTYKVNSQKNVMNT